MGWPQGWSGSTCSETEWSLWKRRMRFILYTKLSGGGNTG